MQRSDEELMLAYAGGDMRAFESLYQRHRGPLYRYVLRSCGNATLANDLYQGSWEKIIKARKKYRPQAPFKAWMYRIAHNHLIDHYRRHKPTVEGDPDEQAATTMAPDDHAQQLEQAHTLRAAVEALLPDQKTTLLLKLEAGMDLGEIADATGVNAETAKSRLRYALRKLKNAMAAETAHGSEW